MVKTAWRRDRVTAWKNGMFWVLLLVLAWGTAGAACARLCPAAVRAAAVGRDPDPDRHPRNGHDLTLYEAAFLSGGPGRVAELTLVSMARQRRLLLAHTGWATVAEPHLRAAFGHREPFPRD